jgi:hypothetical protein
MKEAYAVRRIAPPSAEIQASIDKVMSQGMVDDPQKMLSELARLEGCWWRQRSMAPAVWISGRRISRFATSTVK